MKKRNKDMFDRTWYNHYLRRKEYEKIKNVLKSCLLVAIMVTVTVSLYNFNVIYSDAKDTTKNITGFMQDPKKNYNTKTRLKSVK